MFGDFQEKLAQSNVEQMPRLSVGGREVIFLSVASSRLFPADLEVAEVTSSQVAPLPLHPQFHCSPEYISTPD